VERILPTVDQDHRGAGTNFTSNFNLGVNSAVMGSLYGDAGAIYQVGTTSPFTLMGWRVVL